MKCWRRGPDGDRRVGPHRKIQEEAFFLTVFRNVPDSIMIKTIGHPVDFRFFAAHVDGTRIHRFFANDDARDFCATCADESVETENFSFVQRETHSARFAGAHDVFNAENLDVAIHFELAEVRHPESRPIIIFTRSFVVSSLIGRVPTY